MTEKVTKDMTMGEIMDQNPEAAYMLMDMGLGCASCPVSQFESIEDGAGAHGLDPQAVIDRLNDSKDENTDDKKE